MPRVTLYPNQESQGHTWDRFPVARSFCCFNCWRTPRLAFVSCLARQLVFAYASQFQRSFPTIQAKENNDFICAFVASAGRWFCNPRLCEERSKLMIRVMKVCSHLPEFSFCDGSFYATNLASLLFIPSSLLLLLRCAYIPPLHTDAGSLICAP